VRTLINRPFRGDDRPRVGRSRVPVHRRLLAARSAAAYWAVVALLALATAGLVSRLANRATAAERRWGATRPVLIAKRALPPGQPVPAAGVAVEERPRALVPVGALARLPAGAVAIAPVERGEVLTAARLGEPGAGLAPGRAAMAVPVGDAPLRVRPGQRVDVFATFDASLAAPGADATDRVATGATVVRADAAAITVAVRTSEAAALARALAQGTTTLALISG